MDLRLKLSPAVAIVGRPNVGKSTLFNRLLGARKAITSPTPGTTTDISFGSVKWRDITITAIDTAGLDLTSANATPASLKKQAKLALAKAHVILFVVDGEEGMMPGDRELARDLFKSGKPIVFGMSKADSPQLRSRANDAAWAKLGLGIPLPFSGVNGSGVGDLLDVITDKLKELSLDSAEIPDIDLRVAIIGRPNAGKSSLLNSLVGEERVTVSEIPHTTKEPQDTLLTVATPAGDKHILLIDTVGIRKKAKVAQGMEKLGVHLSLETLLEADVIFLLIDAEGGVGLQEKKLAGLIEEKKPGLLVVVNKWDIARDQNLGTFEEYRHYLAGELSFLDWADITYISAKHGRGVGTLIDKALHIAANRDVVVPQEKLDAFVAKLKRLHHARFARGEKRPKVYGMTQTGTRPPEFVLVAHDKDTLHTNFLRFVENRLRDEFGFRGTPIRVVGREISKGNKVK